MIELAPSILSADFGRLAEQVAATVEGGATVLHVDVMDGHFVPNLTLGPPVVKSLRRHTDLPLDVHLMIEDPDKFIPAFVSAGADWISVHQETCRHLHRTLELIRSQGASPGVVINPATPVQTLGEVLGLVDFVLVMSVNPGFGGQKFIPGTINRIKKLKALIQQTKSKALIEIDGGVTAENAANILKAGADVLVAGNTVFKSKNPAETIASLKHLDANTIYA